MPSSLINAHVDDASPEPLKEARATRDTIKKARKKVPKEADPGREASQSGSPAATADTNENVNGIRCRLQCRLQSEAQGLLAWRHHWTRKLKWRRPDRRPSADEEEAQENNLDLPMSSPRTPS